MNKSTSLIFCTKRSFSTSSSTSTSLRKNKRSPPSRDLSPLFSIYHLSPRFLPLSPSKLKPYLVHAFAPNPTVGSAPPAPARLSQLLNAKETIEINATRGAISLTKGGAELDIKATDWVTNIGIGSVHESNYQDSFDRIAIEGSERPLQARMRRIVDKLHGTEGGGQAGVEITVEMRETARETRKDWEEDRARRSAEKEKKALLHKRKEEEDEQEEIGFTSHFEEDLAPKSYSLGR